MQRVHLRLLVGDFAGCFRVYPDVLGLEPAYGDETIGYADLRAADGSGLALSDRNEQAEVIELRPPGDSAAAVVGVDDVDSFASRVGDALLGPPKDRSDWGIRVVYIRDLDGNLVELNQPIPMEE